MGIDKINKKVDDLQAKVLIEKGKYDNPYTRKATWIALAVGFLIGIVVRGLF